MIKTIWNWIKEKIHILVMGSVVLASGGAVADSAINPYIETPTRFEISKNMGDEGIQNINFAKNKPEMTLGKWNDEVNIKISRKGTFSKGNRALFSDKVKYENAKEEINVYPLDATAEMDEGGFEYEVILKEKPNTNVISMDIETQGLDFFYQPALTQKEIDEGANRPENVIGSYAVYHSTKANHIVGQTNYKTGKAFHIYRPKIKDANGNEIWGELDIKGNSLTITIDQNWLDTAVYPVICDPTFGHTGIGASYVNNFEDRQRGTKYTASESGTVTSLSVYWDTYNSRGLAIYQKSDDTLQGNTANVSDNFGPGWQTLDLISSTAITAQDYVLVAASWSSVGGNLYYDAVSSTTYYKFQEVGSTFPDPFDGTITISSYKYSIYATYTASGGAASPPPSNIFILD